MKLFLTLLLLTLFSFTTTTIIQATCGDTWSGSTETSSANCGDGVNETAGTLTKTVTWAHIFWLDGYDRPNVSVSDNGQTGYPGLTGSCAQCWPRFDTPYFDESAGTAYWIQKTYPGRIVLDSDTCWTVAQPSSDHRQGHTCRCGAGMSNEWPDCEEAEGCTTDTCPGQCFDGLCTQTPIVLDVLGNGFNLTNLTGGVAFDLNVDGRAEQVSWSSFGSDDAWLVLDRNTNGRIDNGAELFGEFTPQPKPAPGSSKNGFIALAEFDKSKHAGNDDGVISAVDAIFASLRLWQDLNHNGISEASELKTLSDVGVVTIELNYKTAKKTDENGNQFRYRSKVRDAHGTQINRWAWDVLLISNP